MEQGLPLKRKRRRRTLACEECRRRKVKCDRELPCANCVQAYKPEQCFYQPDPMVVRSPPPSLHQLSQYPHDQQQRRQHQQHQQHQNQPHQQHTPQHANRLQERGTAENGNASSSSSSTSSEVAAGVLAGSTAPGGGRGGGGGNSALEISEWPPAPGTTASSPASFHGYGHERRHGHSHSRSHAQSHLQSHPPSHAHSHPHGHPHPYSSDSHGYLSPLSASRGIGCLLPGFSSVSGGSEAEVLSLKDQVRRLESQLAFVLGGHDQPSRAAPTSQASQSTPILPPLSPRPPPSAASASAPAPTPTQLPVLPSPTHLLTGNGYRPSGSHDMAPDGPGEDRHHHSKSRYISRGHWMNGALLTLMKPLHEKVMSKREIRTGIEKCKSLGRSIKASRMPTLLRTLDVGHHVPSRRLADKLVNSYFRTFESVYRILHIPTFMKAYQRYWENPGGASTVFVVQMQLCMAIGVCFYDDTCSLRDLATQWIYEAQIWQMAPAQFEKSRMTVAGLQSMCLLHLARETSGVGADLLWVSAGSLVRSAMHLGLHRDPSRIPKVPRFLAEIRRRLWATVLELALQSSLDSGGPPLIALTDFDTAPPANLFDDQLAEKSSTASSMPESAATPAAGSFPPSSPPTTFTNTSIQIALFKSFPTRLTVARYINDFRNSGSYDETLRLNSELRSVCQSLSTTLQSFCTASNTGNAGKMRPSAFHLRLVEHLTQRCFLSLNQAFLAASQSDPKYYFSRKVSVDTALKLFQACVSRHAPSASSGGVRLSSKVPDIGSTPPPSSHWSAIVANSSSGSGRDGGGGGASVSSLSTSPGLSSHGLRNHSFTPTSAADMADEPDDFHRLCVTASGAFRSVPAQCFATLGMELLWQLEEEHSVRLSLGIVGGHGIPMAVSSAAEMGGNPAAAFLTMPGVVAQSVLLDSVENAILFTEQRITAGETNVKGSLFLCAILAQARALMRSADKADVEQAILTACGAQLEHCVELLQKVASRHAAGGGADENNTSAAQSLEPAIAGPDPNVGGNALNSNGMDGLSAIMDVSIPISGEDWVWEDLDQDFDFNFGTSSEDTFFQVI